MTKKAYMQPAMNVVKIQQQRVICASQYGMDTKVQSEEVDNAWSRGNSGWDDEELPEEESDYYDLE